MVKKLLSSAALIAPFANALKQALSAQAHADVPIKYSRIMFQPITKAINSPTVTYEYMYAEPVVCGTRTPNSA